MRPWGDGLVDLSYTTLLGPADWTRVDRDELVLFLPALARTGPCAGSGDGPAPFVRRALDESTARAADLLARYLRRGGGADGGAVAALHADLGLGARAPAAAASRTFVMPGLPQSRRTLRRRLVRELAVRACLAACLGDRERPERLRCATPGEALSPADAAIVALHARINAAYLDPALAYAHETFALAAWIGTATTGRPSLLPRFLAEVALDVLARAADAGCGANCGSEAAPAAALDRLLAAHIDAAIGSRRMLRAARHCLDDAGAVLVTPHWRALERIGRLPAWNEPLFAVLDARLTRAGLAP